MSTHVKFLSPQAVQVWFDDEFADGNMKLEAVRGLTGNELRFDVTESVERRLLASLCYEYGAHLASRFFLPTSLDVISDPVAKKATRQMAHRTLWSRLPNLHRYARQKLPFGSSILTLKAACFNMVSLGVSNKCKPVAKKQKGIIPS